MIQLYIRLQYTQMHGTFIILNKDEMSKTQKQILNEMKSFSVKFLFTF